jgi:hypothetical protein
MLINILMFLLGIAVVAAALTSAVLTLVLPRGTRDFLEHMVFRLNGLLFLLPTRLARSYEQRDRVMALYAPLTLLLLPVSWLTLVLIGYMMMYWTVGERTWSEAFLLSGSSLFTLGFAQANTTFELILVFSEAAIGLGMIALLIAYLPSMYSAFSSREKAVNLLEVRAGSPPSAVEWLRRGQRNQWLENLGEEFGVWESWFAELEESHTSLSALVFFRSPQPDRSWITASGAVMDSAALMLAAVDVEFDDRNAKLCLRAGYLALWRIADLFGIWYNAEPRFPDEPISVSRQEYFEACTKLANSGVPLKEDLEQGWLDFAGWRVNYDRTLVALAALTRAPYAPWSSDRSVTGMHDTLPG